ncbi:MAG: VanZ family protein [bacterium]
MFRKRLLYWLPALCWASVIFHMSTRSSFPQPPFWFENMDKVIHFILFGTLSGFVFFALKVGHGMRFPVAALLAVLISSAYGGSDEIHQLFTAGRSSDPRDWVADTLGACTVFLFAFIPQRKSPPAIVPYGLRKM